MKRPSPVVWYIFPPIGGPGLGRYWRGYHLAQAWQAAGAEPTLIGPGYHHYFQQPVALAGAHKIHDVRYQFIPTKPYGDRARDRLKAILTFGIGLMTDKGMTALGADAPPDVVVYSSPYPFGYVAAHRLARRYGASLVFEVRDLWPLSLTEILGLPAWHPFVLAAGACERFAYATADRVVSLLPGAEAHMAGRGLAAGKFVYIPNGIEMGHAASAVRSLRSPLIERARALKEEGKFLLVHPGNMSVTTHLEPLLDAARRLQDQGRSDIAILLVGRGETEEALKAQAHRLHLANVAFFPQVDKAEVAALLGIADAGFAALSPSPIYRFGYSLNKLFDYMLARLPIVFACDQPDSMVERAGAGLRTPAGDPTAIATAIANLAELPAPARAAMGARGHAFVEAEHDYERLARRYMRVFADLRPDVFSPAPAPLPFPTASGIYSR